MQRGLVSPYAVTALMGGSGLPKQKVTATRSLMSRNDCKEGSNIFPTTKPIPPLTLYMHLNFTWKHSVPKYIPNSSVTKLLDLKAATYSVLTQVGIQMISASIICDVGKEGL